jgi:hypothetical protein
MDLLAFGFGFGFGYLTILYAIYLLVHGLWWLAGKFAGGASLLGFRRGLWRLFFPMVDFLEKEKCRCGSVIASMEVLAKHRRSDRFPA